MKIANLRKAEKKKKILVEVETASEYLEVLGATPISNDVSLANCINGFLFLPKSVANFLDRLILNLEKFFFRFIRRKEIEIPLSSLLRLIG